MSNRQNYYERKYKRIQDIISDIGGINQFITIVATSINFLFNDYIVLSDTQNLLFSSINTAKNNDKKHKKEIVKPNKLENIKNNSLSKDKKINNIITEKPINKIDKNNISHKNIPKNDNENNAKSLMSLIQENSNKNSQQKINYDNMKVMKGNNFFSYLIFKLSFEKKNVHLRTFKDFRMKMLSEEHLMKSHLNIYNLLRVNERKKSFRRKSYHLKDLINLV